MVFLNINAVDIKMGKNALDDAKEHNKKWYDAVIESEMLFLIFAESEDKIEQAEVAWLMHSKTDFDGDISNIDLMIITNEMVNEQGIDSIKEQIRNKNVALVDWD